MPSPLEDQLVSAGRRLLEEGGVAAVSVREVARRCEVSHGAPRRHFPTLALLLAAVAEQCLHELRARIGEADDLFAAARAYVDYAVQHPHAFDLVTRHDLLKGSGHHLRATSMPMLADWQARYRRHVPGATELQGSAAWAAVHGVATLASRDAFEPFGLAPEQLLAELLPPHRG